jgi:hypothetical protein
MNPHSTFKEIQMDKTMLQQVADIVDASLTCEEQGVVMQVFEPDCFQMWVNGKVYEVSVKFVRDSEYPE